MRLLLHVSAERNKFSHFENSEFTIRGSHEYIINELSSNLILWKTLLETYRISLMVMIAKAGYENPLFKCVGNLMERTIKEGRIPTFSIGIDGKPPISQTHELIIMLEKYGHRITTLMFNSKSFFDLERLGPVVARMENLTRFACYSEYDTLELMDPEGSMRMASSIINGLSAENLTILYINVPIVDVYFIDDLIRLIRQGKLSVLVLKFEKANFQPVVDYFYKELARVMVLDIENVVISTLKIEFKRSRVNPTNLEYERIVTRFILMNSRIESLLNRRDDSLFPIYGSELRTMFLADKVQHFL